MESALIAAQLRELAIYYELDGDKHRAFAYERAAKSVEASQMLGKLIEEGRLEELPNIGPSIARSIAELARRGTVAVLDGMRAKWPPIVVELAMLPRMSVPKARKLWEAFSPADLDAVAAMCRAGAIAELPGFGKTSEKKLLEAIEERRVRGQQALLVDAEPHALAIAAHLRMDPAVERVEVCGPVRRFIEIIEHFAFAVATDAPDAVVDRLASYTMVTSVDRSANPVVAQLADGTRTELYMAPSAQFGWTQIVATGSPEHVAMLTARGAKPGREEADVYASIGLPWIPPEVRDGTDELSGDDFADLITQADLTTATHCHTTYSDGKGTIAEMVRAASEMGYRAITITDHSLAASYAGGLDGDRLREQAAEIAGLVEPEARVLRGTEADINIDGTIDVPSGIDLDVIIASVHQRFKLGEDDMTNRLVAAMRQPFFKIWGHALGRLVMKREPINVRLDEILDAAAESRAAIEINGDPYRLDLDPVNARKAAKRGIKFVLSSDAHSVNGLRAVRFAVAMARRARIRKQDVLNALPVDDFAAAVAPRYD